MSQELVFLRDFIRSQSGLVLTEEKNYLIESRLLPVARKEGLTTISELVTKLRSMPQGPLANTVTEAMTTNETFFFRDKTPFENFEEHIIPSIVQSRGLSQPVRIWCAACSSGQEPYSLSMIASELRAKHPSLKLEIVATDISNDILEKAKMAKYSQFEVQRGLPIKLLMKYFKQEGESWLLKDEIKQSVSFRNLNLLSSFASLGRFDVVFCRNVLIYFNQETKVDVLTRIKSQMQSDSFLVLGAAETVFGLTNAFSPVQGVRGLYKPS